MSPLPAWIRSSLIIIFNIASRLLVFILLPYSETNFLRHSDLTRFSRLLLLIRSFPSVSSYLHGSTKHTLIIAFTVWLSVGHSLFTTSWYDRRIWHECTMSRMIRLRILFSFAYNLCGPFFQHWQDQIKPWSFEVEPSQFPGTDIFTIKFKKIILIRTEGSRWMRH